MRPLPVECRCPDDEGQVPLLVCNGRHATIQAIRGQRCPARFMPASQLDALVWQDLGQVVTHPALIAQALERAHGGHWLPQELQARLRNLKKAAQQLARQQERLLEAYLAEVVQLPEFERKQQELSQKQTALEQQSAQLQATAEQRSRVAGNLPLD